MKFLSVLKSDNNNGFVASAIMAAIFVASIIGHAPFWYPFSFAAVQLLFIYLPGRVFVDFIGIHFKNGINRDFLAYAAGYILSILFYTTFLALHFQSYIILLYIVLCVLCYYLLRKKKKSTNNGAADVLKYAWKDKRILSVIILLTFIVGCMTFQLVNLSPILFSDNSDASIHYDLMYWMRNCVAATKSYPLPDLSYSGNPLFYHYFSSLEIAFLHFVTGIEIFDLCFTYSHLVNLFLLISGAYVLISKIILNEKLIYICLCFLLFTTNFEFFSLISLSTHIYAASFGLTESLGIFFFALYVYLEYQKDRANSILAFLLFLFFGIIGLKAPVAVVLLAGIGCNELYLSYKTRNLLGSFKPIACLLVIFAAVLVLFVSGPALQQSFKEGGGHYMNLSLTGTVVVFTNRPFEALFGISVPFWMRYCISFLFFIVVIYFVHLILFFTLLLSGRKKRTFHSQPIDFLLLPLILFGTLVTLFVSHPGRSQMYFIFPSILCCYIWLFSKFDELQESKSIKVAFNVAFILGFLVFVIQNAPLATLGTSRFMRSSNRIPASACDFVQKKAETIFQTFDKNYYDILSSHNSGTSFSKDEIEGLRWVRDNLPSSVLLISNKIFGQTGNDEFSMDLIADFDDTADAESNLLKQVTSSHSTITSSFTERQLLMEGYWFSNYSDSVVFSNLHLIKHFFLSDGDAYDTLKKNGVNHAVIFKRISPHGYPDNCGLLFENNAIAIVKI